MKDFYLHRYIFGILLGVFFFSLPATATHIRAGDISTRRISASLNTYEIIVRGYADRDSPVLFGSNGTLDFGDGTTLVLENDGDDIPRTAISDDTWLYELVVSHTFPSSGPYVVSFREFYRNEGVLNMDNSVNMPFYVETYVLNDGAFGRNSSPVLTRPAIDDAFVGKTFHHQPGAVDAEGDSLAYVLVPSRQDKNTRVANYRQPNNVFPSEDNRNGTSEAGGSPLFSINAVSGDIIWDAPGTAGEYNMAFQVQEWRKINGTYQMLGYVVRDLQIIVENATGANPEISYPFTSDAVAPAAGEVHEWTITAQAPIATDPIVLEVWGDFLTRTNAVVSQQQVEATGEASITIRWTGEENLGQHYQLIARSYYPNTPYTARSRSTIFYANPNATEPLSIGNPNTAALKMHPNPLRNGLLTLEVAEAVGKETKLLIYDTRGTIVYQKKMKPTQAQHQLELKELKKGVYVVQLQYGGRLYTNKLIIQ